MLGVPGEVNKSREEIFEDNLGTEESEQTQLEGAPNTTHRTDKEKCTLRNIRVNIKRQQKHSKSLGGKKTQWLAKE